jgi:hypothetical protein
MDTAPISLPLVPSTQGMSLIAPVGFSCRCGHEWKAIVTSEIGTERRHNMLEILDSLIATITFVLVLSLIVQAIQQIIKQAWSFKSSYMERELLAMFQQKLLPSVQVLSNGNSVDIRPIALQAQQARKSEPEIKDLIALLRSKLASIGYNDLSLLETMNKDEVSSLLDLVAKDLAEELKTPAAKVTAEVIEKGQKVMAAIEKAKKDVENWYDLTLKAFQDHYERRMKMWSYVLSLVVVVGLNGNLFDIYREFSTNSKNFCK